MLLRENVDNQFERPFLRCHAPQPWLPLPKLQTAEKDFHAPKANHPKEVFDVILPAGHESSKMMKPSEKPFHTPALAVAPQRAKGACMRDVYEVLRQKELEVSRLPRRCS
jgi:hypothetical protein